MSNPLTVRSNNRTLNRSAAAGVVLLALGGFTLSFSSLRDLAIASDIQPQLAFVWPPIVDGFIVVATASAFALKRRGRRVTWYPWSAVIVFSAISVTGNSLHALDAPSLRVPIAVAAVVSSVPALARLIASHLLVVMIDGSTRSISTSESLAPTAERISVPVQTAQPETYPPSSPRQRSVLHAVDMDGRDVVAQLREFVADGGAVTGAVIARLADVSERTGRRRLEELRRAHPELFDSEAQAALAR